MWKVHLHSAAASVVRQQRRALAHQLRSHRGIFCSSRSRSRMRTRTRKRSSHLSGQCTQSLLPLAAQPTTASASFATATKAAEAGTTTATGTPKAEPPPIPPNPMLQVDLKELGVTMVKDKYTARRVLKQLMDMAGDEDRYHACDTEVAGAWW